MQSSNDTRTARPEIRVGLPYSSAGVLCSAAAGGPTLISAGSLRRRSEASDGSREWRFAPIGLAAWRTRAALDSAGFVAMLQGGYRWDVSEYVEFVVTNSGDGSRPFPWEWWSAMDYCCEPEIAGDRAEVERRVAMTVESYRETLDELDFWRDEGVTDVPDPLPILQGRRPEDYVACAEALAEVLREAGRDGLPALVGLGSVCRRDLHGDEGLLGILDALHAALPEGVRLHLFGVKGDALPHLIRRYAGRVASIDSMAWDFRARKEARAAGISNTVAHRAQWLAYWRNAQLAKIEQAHSATDSATDSATERPVAEVEAELAENHFPTTTESAPALDSRGATMSQNHRPGAFASFLQGVVADCIDGEPAPTLETREAMRLFDLGFERASYLATTGRDLSHPSAPDDVVVELLGDGAFELLLDCASVCPRAAEVSAGAAAYLADRPAWLRAGLDAEPNPCPGSGGEADVGPWTGATCPRCDEAVLAIEGRLVPHPRPEQHDPDCDPVACRVNPCEAASLPAAPSSTREGLLSFLTAAANAWNPSVAARTIDSLLVEAGSPDCLELPPLADCDQAAILRAFRASIVLMDGNAEEPANVVDAVELLASILDPEGRSWRLVPGHNVVVCVDAFDVLSERSHGEISAATFRASGVLAAEFALPLRDVLADEDLQNEARALGERFLNLQLDHRRRAYRATMLAEHGSLDDLVGYLSDRVVFPLPTTIGEWCLGGCPSGAIYLGRQGDPTGPTVWASPGWDGAPELLLQVDLDAEGLAYTRWILVPWTADPRLDAALYAAAVLPVLDELAGAEGVA